MLWIGTCSVAWGNHRGLSQSSNDDDDGDDDDDDDEDEDDEDDVYRCRSTDGGHSHHIIIFCILYIL